MARSSPQPSSKKKKAANPAQGNENIPPVVSPSSKRKAAAAASPSKSKSTKKGHKHQTQSLKDAEKEIAALRKQLEDALKLDPKKASDEVKTPKPKGGFGTKNGNNIQEAMGLTNGPDDDDSYNSILFEARNTALKAQIDFNDPYSKQDDEKVVKFCRALRTKFPILGKYKNSWASRAILQQFITNRRRYLNKKAKLRAKRQGKGKGRVPVDIEELEADDSEAAAAEGSDADVDMPPASDRDGASSEEDIDAMDINDDDDD
ncbi:hypothetical protein FA95DRAFT_1424332 [Auriscalpium vulgare]|uniref:Uncharacterized protein n=1 Tax=Auriscalpium vulgare TaxID=40419 RepID=A0ACB8RR99_9AGAM|nr:hypothetical protein FA95DRAFT_1424332 [Auriscalpium vulgare]